MKLFKNLIFAFTMLLWVNLQPAVALTEVSITDSEDGVFTLVATMDKVNCTLLMESLNFEVQPDGSTFYSTPDKKFSIGCNPANRKHNGDLHCTLKIQGVPESDDKTITEIVRDETSARANIQDQVEAKKIFELLPDQNGAHRLRIFETTDSVISLGATLIEVGVNSKLGYQPKPFYSAVISVEFGDR